MRLIIFSIFLISSLYSNVNLKSLSNNKSWLSLLHYNPYSKTSDIISKNFFIDKNGNIDPYQELNATIKAYNNRNYKIICNYPARYLWLSKKIKYINFKKIINSCKHLKNWRLAKDIDSISIIFVSGFLGNPASTFGHSFIKINKKNQNSLLDNTISFGAKLPKKYTMVSYIVNGLFGGYRGRYTDEYYYMNDIAYSNQDFRDMWEYKLKLNNFQKRLLVYHFWELRKSQFRYYFLNRNCGYRVSEFINIISKDNFISKSLIWYAPIDTFYRLDNANLTYKVIYHPSLEKIVKNRYYRLSKKNQKIIKKFIKDKNSSIEILSNNTKLYDYILDYYNYLMENMDKNDKDYKELSKRKNKLLLQRIKLPKSKESNIILKEKDITYSSYPSYLSLSFNKNSVYLNYSPYSNEDISLNLLNGDIFKVLDIELKISKRSLKLYRIDYVNIRKLTDSFDLKKFYETYSWRLLVSTSKDNNRFNTYLDAGIGYSWKIFNNTKLFSFVNLYVDTNKKIKLYPSLGLYFDFDKLKTSINIYKKSHEKIKYNVNMQYNFNNKEALYLKITKDNKIKTYIGLKWYF